MKKFSSKLWKAIWKKVGSYYDYCEDFREAERLEEIDENLYIVLRYQPTGWTPKGERNLENGDIDYFYEIPRNIWCPVVSSFGIKPPFFRRYK